MSAVICIHVTHFRDVQYVFMGILMPSFVDAVKAVTFANLMKLRNQSTSVFHCQNIVLFLRGTRVTLSLCSQITAALFLASNPYIA